MALLGLPLRYHWSLIRVSVSNMLISSNLDSEIVILAVENFISISGSSMLLLSSLGPKRIMLTTERCDEVPHAESSATSVIGACCLDVLMPLTLADCTVAEIDFFLHSHWPPAIGFAPTI